MLPDGVQSQRPVPRPKNTPSVVWEQQTHQYAQGYDAKVGKWIVGSVAFDSLRTKGSKAVHKARCRLPGIKESLGNYEHESEARERVERAVAHWFREAIK